MSERVQIYYAPLEGVTGHVFRGVHREVYGGVDRYYAPFISPADKRGIRNRELKDILPENNEGICLVPQILTNQAGGFLKVAEMLSGYGYKEINLNLGCPAGTVVKRRKGSGFLASLEKLNIFLEEIFEKRKGYEISIKTRLGMYEAEEFGKILSIYNQYPVKELTIHPRVREDFYKNKPRLSIFGEALRESRNPVCYNGDVRSVKDFQMITKAFPSITAVMCGRGFLGMPELPEALQKEACEPSLERKEGEAPVLTDKKRLFCFHDRLYKKYMETLYGYQTVLHKMKELWIYMEASFLFPLSETKELPLAPEQKTTVAKAVKKIKKAEKQGMYEDGVKELFAAFDE